MPEVPPCLHRRYQALDRLVNDLCSTRSNASLASSREDPGIKLMCNFWNILKENPSCDLPHVVQERMGVVSDVSSRGYPQRVTCYMAGTPTNRNTSGKDAMNKIKTLCKECDTKKPNSCCISRAGTPKPDSDHLPLSKVLCDLNEAAYHEVKCAQKLNKLMETQQTLQDQINNLENKEKQGLLLLKEADCMWTCMEETYKKKLADSQENQKTLMNELKRVEASVGKWRKNMKDLEFQLSNLNNVETEIMEKKTQKQNDIKSITAEIEDLKNRIENNKKDTEATKKSLSSKKQASDKTISCINAEVAALNKQLAEERRVKKEKEAEGAAFIKAAREDLIKMSQCLLKKKLENEDLRAEKDAILQEIALLKTTTDMCKDKCKAKQKSIEADIKKIEKEIADFKVKCIQCHQCTDTEDVRKFCVDCPRCMAERECLTNEDHCSADHSLDCVCMSVKRKFLDNVFDNMYTVLERQAKTEPGKAVADTVLQSLKRSRNGKLDESTRNLLQKFILTTVKQNLNLTIVGGAVKTRCEMEADTYKQLMLCLQQVKATRAPKQDRGTVAKKEPCRRWGGTSECHCPKGPKSCVCTKRAPPPPHDPTPCPPKDEEDEAEVTSCPHRDLKPCGVDCASHASKLESDLASWRQEPCKDKSCTFSKNMRAAQCMLGPESLTVVKGNMSCPPLVAFKSPEDTSNFKKLEAGYTQEDAKQLKADLCDKILNREPFTTIEPSTSESLVEKEIENISKQHNKADLILMKNDDVDTKTYVAKSDENGSVKSSTSSGNLVMAVDERVLEELEKNTHNSEIALSLKKTSSGHFVINFDSTETVNSEGKKAVLTAISKSLISHTKSALNEMIPEEAKQTQQQTLVQNLNHCSSVLNVEFFPIEIKGLKSNVSKHAAVLKLTDSGNYQLILDKEFEKLYDQAITEFMGENKSRQIELGKTCAGFYTDLEDSDRNDSHPNAYLAKTPSGNFKILVNTGFINAINKVSSKFPCNISSDSLRNQINRVQLSCKDILEYTKRKVLDTKCKSDSQIYEKIKTKLDEKKDQVLQPSAIMQQSSGGKYSVVLSKESKKALINNLSQLSKSQGYIPITRTESGEITIILKKCSDSSHNFEEALKITSSGNMYLIVDDKSVRELNRESRIEQTSLGNSLVMSNSQHLMEPNINPASKGLSATVLCDSICDRAKCHCSELQNRRELNENDRLERSPLSPIKEKRCENQTRRREESPKRDITIKTSPHRQKGQYSCSSTAKKPKGNEQCFFVSVDHSRINKSKASTVKKTPDCSVSKLANLKSRAVSQPKKKSKLLKENDKHEKSHRKCLQLPNGFDLFDEWSLTQGSISELNNKNSTLQTSGNWSSLHQMPLQLPYFLKNIEHHLNLK